MKSFSLSAIGRDQPGIVAAITEPLFKRGCNIEDSSMTILGAEFAVILLMTIPQGVDFKALVQEIKEVGKECSLTIDMKEVAGGAPEEPTALSNYILTLYGEDTTGLIYKTACLLLEEKINITDLETKTAHEEDEGKGKNLYMMMMELYISAETDLPGLKDRLKALGEELGVSIRLKPIEDFGRL
ncbi:MAG: glycine cleavage system protein R [Thermodesulfobacteriota bacterium]